MIRTIEAGAASGGESGIDVYSHSGVMTRGAMLGLVKDSTNAVSPGTVMASLLAEILRRLSLYTRSQTVHQSRPIEH